jgi:hypothetical protein
MSNKGLQSESSEPKGSTSLPERRQWTLQDYLWQNTPVLEARLLSQDIPATVWNLAGTG